MSEYERKALREHAEHHYGENQMKEPSNLELLAIAIAAAIVGYVLLVLAMAM
jgi:hypothetical protein